MLLSSIDAYPSSLLKGILKMDLEEMLTVDTIEGILTHSDEEIRSFGALFVIKSFSSQHRCYVKFGFSNSIICL